MHMDKYKLLGMKIRTKNVDIHPFKTVLPKTDFGKLNMLGVLDG